MRSVVKADLFREALAKAYAACVKKSKVSALENVLVRFHGETCTLTGTDMTVWCETELPARGDSFAFILTDTKQLLTACKFFSGALFFEYTRDQPPAYEPYKTDLGGTIIVQCSGRTCMQRVSSEEDFPMMPKVKTTEDYTVEPAVLARRFERIKYALDECAARSNQQCIRFQDDRMIAVDGYRLAVSKDASLNVSRTFLVPPAAMRLLPVLGEASCRMMAGREHLVFDAENVRVTVRIPWEEPLNLDKIIPSSAESCQVDVGAFLKELRYLDEFITEPRAQSIRFEGGLMSLQHAISRPSTRLQLSEPPMTVVAFRGQYMMQALKQFSAKKTQTVTMGLTSSYAPIVLTDGDGDLALILPCRLSDAEAA